MLIIRHILCLLLSGIFLCACLEVASAQDLGEITVEGATLESVHWGAIYLLKTCTNCTEPTPEEIDKPKLVTYLVRVYRANAAETSISVRTKVSANSPFRDQLDESVQQAVTVTHPFNAAQSAEDSGPPSEELNASVRFDWTSDLCEAVVPVHFIAGANTGGSTLLWKSGVAVVQKVRVNIVILPPQAHLTINPSQAPTGGEGPKLIRRDSVGLNFNIRGCGLHPYQQLKTVELDGSALTEVPYDASDPFGPVVAAGQFTTLRAQPDGDPLEPPQHAISDPQLWLGNVGGCCRPSASATFSFSQGFVPGRHRLNVGFKPVSYALTPAIKEDILSPIALEQEFIIFGPDVELSSTSLSPGQTFTVNGTGFAPNATVKVFAKVKSFSAGEREVELGTAFTSLEGGVSETFQLPGAGSDFWTNLSAWNLNPPQPQPGLIRVFVDNTDFHRQFDYLESDLQFCQVDVLPQGNATGKCPIRVGVLASVNYTTSATSVPSPASPDAPSLLGPANDTVPFEIDPDPQQAAVVMSWQNNDDPGSDPVGLWLNLYQWDFLSESWTLLIEQAAQGTSWTFTGDLGLNEFNCYAWRVYAVDWTQRSDPWFTPSEWSLFCTTLPGVFVDLGPLPDPDNLPEGSPPVAAAPDIGGLTVEQALDVNANNLLDDLEILQAVGYWIKGDIVPDTDQAIDDRLILNLIMIWILGTMV